jgi:hypothetical protein
MIEYWCYDCGSEKECDECGHIEWVEGKGYRLIDYSIELQERFVFQGQCCECGGTRVEQ